MRNSWHVVKPKWFNPHPPPLFVWRSCLCYTTGWKTFVHYRMENSCCMNQKTESGCQICFSEQFIQMICPSFRIFKADVKMIFQNNVYLCGVLDLEHWKLMSCLCLCTEVMFSIQWTRNWWPDDLVSGHTTATSLQTASGRIVTPHDTNQHSAKIETTHTTPCNFYSDLWHHITWCNIQPKLWHHIMYCNI